VCRPPCAHVSPPSTQGTGEELKLDFELSDNLYAKAKVKDAKTVNIWLGANVMLEYEIGEVPPALHHNLPTYLVPSTRIEPRHSWLGRRRRSC
jgi:hypothetical protein